VTRATTGILPVDKPAGPTSRSVLDALERRLGLGTLGHAGTLDPLASGLLVVLAGRARRLQEFFLGRDKTYRARVRFGATSPTLDGEGPVRTTGVRPAPVSRSEAAALVARFAGDIDQTPPAFSALRVAGRRAHRLARLGRDVALESRRVTIHEIAIVAIDEPDWVVDLRCGPGVYVRSLARDLGAARGTGAYLAELRRTRSGQLSVDDAVAADAATPADLRPLAAILRDEPRIDVGEDEARRLARGDVIAGQAPAAPPRTSFAWFRGRPCFRLTVPAPGLLRSDLMLEPPG
jgi:tRNA pseudouridine55 synthase